MSEPLSDAILLERYVSRREEAAFVMLLERHGPLVERTCRRVLRNEHDVQDVFQATFLVLARRAAGIAWRDSVGGWLAAVALRLAKGARADLSRQHHREIPMTQLAARFRSAGVLVSEAGLLDEVDPFADPIAEVERRELRRLVRTELLDLPEKYRSPVVLCYFEGRTHEEAARQLGYPAGSMSRRLKRAGVLLRRRLLQRGFMPAVVLLLGGFVVLSASIICYRQSDAAAPLRSAMATLEPLCDGEKGIQTVIAQVERPTADRDCERILAFSRRASQVAQESEEYVPGKLPDEWRELSAEMRASAGLLAYAAQRNDQSSMLTAARRLGATCVACHEAFR